MIINNAVLTGSFTVNGVNYITNTPTTGSNTYVGTQTTSGSAIITGSLQVTGSVSTTGTITAQTLVVQTVTSSIVYSSGSNIFGNQLTNVQQMTGSLRVTGSVNVVGLNIIGSGNDFAGGGFGTTTLSNTQTVAAGAVIGTYQGGFSFIDLATRASAGSWIDFSSGSGDDYQGRIRYNNGTQQMNFYTSASGTPLFNIGGSNVGIGTITPSAKLDVNGSVVITGSLNVSAASTFLSNINPLRVNIGGASNDADISLNVSAPSGSGKYIMFGRDSSNTAVMTISSSGAAGFRSVDIGSLGASGTYKLGVSGSAYINGSNGKGIFISDQATYASVVGLNSAISTYNGLELRASGTDYQLYLNTDGRVFVNANGSSAYFDGKINSYGDGTVPGACFKNAGNSQFTCAMWNAAGTGDNAFLTFVTDASPSVRGGIDYNRAGAVVRYNTSSDANLKNIIGYSDKQKSIDILNSTKIREFSWKEDKTNKSQIGVIAQELYETFKGAVSVGSDESLLGTEDYKNWAVDKTAFTFHLIAGWQKHEQLIQEQQTQIQSQNTLIQELTTRLTSLENK